MTLALCAVSHSPLIGMNDPDDCADARAALQAAARFVAAFEPDVAVVFAPDHLNGFVYRTLPQFCVGTSATSIGDWSTAPGDVLVASTLAESLAAALLEADVDVAVSARMHVDHAFAQPLEMLFGGLDRLPIVPVFVNAAGPPLSPMRRSRVLGDAAGRFLGACGERVLVVGSGGLSHDPPTPSVHALDPEVRERVIEGVLSIEARRRREAGIVDVAQDFVAGRRVDMRPLDAEIDREFLAAAAAGDVARMVAIASGPRAQSAGRGFQEVRAWIAACAALATAGDPTVDTCFYRAIPEWISGFAVLTATT